MELGRLVSALIGCEQSYPWEALLKPNSGESKNNVLAMALHTTLLGYGHCTGLDEVTAQRSPLE